MKWPWKRKRPCTNGRAAKSVAASADAIEDADAKLREASRIAEGIRRLREHDAFADAIDQALRGH